MAKVTTSKSRTPGSFVDGNGLSPSSEVPHHLRDGVPTVTDGPLHRDPRVAGGLQHSGCRFAEERIRVGLQMAAHDNGG